MRFQIAALVVLFAGGTMPATCLADIQDQSNPPINELIGYLQIFSNFSTGQVVQVGLNGQLSRIELGVTDDGAVSPLFIDIAKTVVTANGRMPDFSTNGRITTRTVDASLIPDSATASLNLSVDLTGANLNLNANDFFSIILRTDSPHPAFGWFASVDNVEANTYPAGASYHHFYSENQTVTLGYDQAFRTFVLVPEPTSAWLVLTIVVGVGTQARCGRPR